MKNDPEAAAEAGVTQMSGWGYLAIVCVYLYGVIYCATWQGITWLYASEIYPLYIRSLCMALTIADERLWSYVVSRSTPYMISDIGYGSKFSMICSLDLRLSDWLQQLTSFSALSWSAWESGLGGVFVRQKVSPSKRWTPFLVHPVRDPRITLQRTQRINSITRRLALWRSRMPAA